jgi:ATP synthase protein I
MNDKSKDREPQTTPSQKEEARDLARKSALALELPFTLVGAVVVGGVLGYFLDRWLHTRPWLMVVFGAFGFFGGVREVIRRLDPNASSGNGD